MSLTFHCPSCGAPLDPPANSQTVLRCPFCHSSVIIPEEIRRQTGSTETLSRDQAINTLPDSSQQMLQIIHLIKSGKRGDAIHVFRETFDSSRSDAEKAVTAIEQGELVSLFHLKKEVTASSAVESGIETNKATRNRTPRRLVIGCVVIAVLLIGIVGALFATGSISFLSGKDKTTQRLTLLRSFGSEGLSPGQFTQAESIAVDLQGNIYIADLTTGRIQQFDKEGNFVHLWDVSDDRLVIWDLEVDQDGILYAAAERTILRFNTLTAERLDPIPNPDNYFFYDLSIMPDGSLAAVAQGSTLLRLNPDGSTQWVIVDAISTIADTSDSRGTLCVDGNGNVYLAGNFVRAVFKFSPAGEYLDRWGSEGEEPGQFDTIYSIAMNPSGQVVVDDWGALEIYDTDGRFIEQIDTNQTFVDIAFDLSGNLYAIKAQNQVQVYQINNP